MIPSRGLLQIFLYGFTPNEVRNGAKLTNIALGHKQP